MAAQMTLTHPVLVRIQAGQPVRKNHELKSRLGKQFAKLLLVKLYYNLDFSRLSTKFSVRSSMGSDFRNLIRHRGKLGKLFYDQIVLEVAVEFSRLIGSVAVSSGRYRFLH